MKAMIAMSGGVDSSVAAYLMQQKGYICAGCTMKLYDRLAETGSREKTCCSLDDVEDARSVAVRLGMPYYVFNYTEAFHREIIDRFVETYLLGRTPNPCIDCNRCMKFGSLLEKALVLGYDKLVTGHYVRVRFEDGRYRLLKGLDPSKDQSYVLYMLTQAQLAHLEFPLGEMTKEEVRQIAQAQGFLNAKKPDSQDICFVPDGDYARVIEEERGAVPPPGDFTDLSGRVLGRHKGIIHYTVGQRKGLGLSFPQPMYVCRIEPESNRVVLAEESALFSREVSVKEMSWVSGEVPAGPFRCEAKIRYRHAAKPALAVPLEDGRLQLVFDEPQRAATPGQSAVLYDDDEVLGGGIIE